MVEQFDLHAFVRAAIVSGAAGLIVGSVIYFALQTRDQWIRWKSAVILGIVGFTVLLVVGTYYRWPSLVVVPTVDNLSQAEAEDLLRESLRIHKQVLGDNDQATVAIIKTLAEALRRQGRAAEAKALLDGLPVTPRTREPRGDDEYNRGENDQRDFLVHGEL